MSLPPIPFYLLCGSLGAGKTTLLLRLLEHWRARGQRIGVLMNEAGQVSIDGPRAGTLAEQVLNLAGGCVCCDTKEDLSWAVAQLVKDDESDVLILECSGMADPAEVIDALTDAYTARLARLERVIALLHPALSDQEGLGSFVTTQSIRCADELILNKRDLYVPGHWESFKASVVERNRYARVWETSHARINPIALLSPVERVPSTPAVNASFGASPDAHPNAHHDAHPIAVTVHLPGPLNRERFFGWIQSLSHGLERAKGFFRFAQEPELQEFQYAPPGHATVAPLVLLEEPDQAIILIGRGYDLDRCRRDLLACLEQP